MKTKFLLFSIYMLVSCISLKAEPPAEEGKAIFLSRCAACHNINKDLTGPALSGLHERRSIEWIISFVQSSQSLIKVGDKDAVALFEKFNRIPMPDHPDLTEDKIKSIVEYIKSESKPAETTTAPFAKPGKKKDAYVPLSIKDYSFFILYFVVVAMLVATLYFAAAARAFKKEQAGIKPPSA